MSPIFVFAVLAYTASAKIILGQDVNYPPYAYKENGKLMGLGADTARGMAQLCPELGIEVVEVKWKDCWTPNGLGAKLENGEVDACMTYTHTKGIRNFFADFSWAVLEVNKAAGLLSMLDENGNPKVTGMDNLAGKKVIDVSGWAPTADGLDFVENKCTGQKYSSDYQLLSTAGPGNNNDYALSDLYDGTADAMFVYADQAYNYKKACLKDPDTPADCAKWSEFGKKFAYVQTGQFGYVNNGTTLALAKKGSGIVEQLNPCIQKFMGTQEYYDICMKYGFKTCYPNSFFPGGVEVALKDYNKATEDHEGDCSTGYCKCTAPAAVPTMSTLLATSNGFPTMGCIIAGFISLSVAFGYALGIRRRQSAAISGDGTYGLLEAGAGN